ncbi:heparinase II/III domain-containing protein [Actinoplanes sp. CA-142083]|uniref:heparinase II/III domain-containing protein n=1 Tax=Actinoplanes sp. CA-142083 TaxID=3239903 RepID=UPI003D94985A
MGPLAAAWPPITAGLLVRSLPPVDGLAAPPALRARAEAELGAPWPTPLASAYARYFKDGNRTGYEEVVWEREYRVSRAAIMAAVTGDPGWLDEVADGVTLLCEQSSWCWPAHDDTFARHQAVVPTVTDPYLDLGAGEVAGQLAWLDHLLGAQLSASFPGLRERIRHEVDRRVLTPFETRLDWHWLGLDGEVHNWNPWIHSNVLVAALQLVDDPARRAAIVARVVEGLDRYAAALPADGAVDEGYSYWWQGACRLFEALDLLIYASDGSLGDEPFHALREVVAFPHRVHLGGDWYLNYADGPARPSREQPWDALHRAALRVGDDAAAAHALAHRDVATETWGLGFLLRALTDRAWASAVVGSFRPAAHTWFPSTQVLIARSERLTLAVKGGHNGENHNHNDVGSFVVALGGVPVLVDPGRPTYTAQTFGPRRYEIWTMQSSWHNTPTIRHSTQMPGRSHGAENACATEASLTMELAPPYGIGIARSWKRTAGLDHDVVVVRDSWELDDVSGTFVHLVVAGEVRLFEGRAEIVALEGAGVLEVAWEPAAPCTLTVRELDDPMLRDVWGPRLVRMDVDVAGIGPVGRLEVTIKEQR